MKAALSFAAGQPAAPKAQKARPSDQQMDLGEAWNHVVLGARVFKATRNLPNNPTLVPLLSWSRRLLSSL